MNDLQELDNYALFAIDSKLKWPKSAPVRKTDAPDIWLDKFARRQLGKLI